jgi:hypothetical protein
MDSIAIRVRAPDGSYWAQLVDPASGVGRLRLVLIERLGLPSQLTYELVTEPGERRLPDGSTLHDAGVTAGSTLAIRPVRDSVYVALIKKLYDEATDFARDQLWDHARERLEQIFQLDPTYPDATQLAAKLGAPGAKTTAAASKPPPQPIPAAAKAAARPPQMKTATAAAGAGVVATFIRRLILLLGVAVIAGGALIYFEAIPAPDWLPDWFPRQSDRGATAIINGVEVGTGDVRVTLTWNSRADIDLHVTDPFGEEIYFGNREAGTGGQLDVDANAGCANQPAVENIFWPTGRAPAGPYGISVQLYADCGTFETRYEATVYVGGALVGRHTGTLSPSAPIATLPPFRR